MISCFHCFFGCFDDSAPTQIVGVVDVSAEQYRHLGQRVLHFSATIQTAAILFCLVLVNS
jgi:hypothetical protein